LTLDWKMGRTLAAVTSGPLVTSYRYDNSGLRIAKDDGTVSHQYVWNANQLVADITPTYSLRFLYDAKGQASGFLYVSGNATTPYFYVKNLQGDIIHVVDSSGSVVATYSYDAWGAPLSSIGSMADVNPLRYRGYYYDSESGFYYLQSRYYDAQTGRFINADDPSMLGADGSFSSANLFVYCANSPVQRVDDGGHCGILVRAAIGFAVGIAVQYVADVVKNVNEGATGKDIFKPSSSGRDYIAAGVGGAISASGAGLISSLATGALGSVTSGFIKKDIHDATDVVEYAAYGLAAGFVGFGVGRLASTAKLTRIESMTTAEKKCYLRDNVYRTKNKYVNKNKSEFRNTSEAQKIANIERQSPVLTSTVFPNVLSSIMYYGISLGYSCAL